MAANTPQRFWKKTALALFLCNLLAFFASAQQGYDLVMAIASPAGRIICSIYGAFVMIAGALATLVIVYAGLKWIASGEDPAQRKVAKSMITHAILALIIILVSDTIVSMVTEGQLQGCEGLMGMIGSGGSCGPTETQLSTSSWGPVNILGTDISCTSLVCCYDSTRDCDSLEWGAANCAGTVTGTCSGSCQGCVGGVCVGQPINLVCCDT